MHASSKILADSNTDHMVKIVKCKNLSLSTDWLILFKIRHNFIFMFPYFHGFTITLPGIQMKNFDR